jgi:hypothetical protein
MSPSDPAVTRSPTDFLTDSLESGCVVLRPAAACGWFCNGRGRRFAADPIAPGPLGFVKVRISARQHFDSLFSWPELRTADRQRNGTEPFSARLLHDLPLLYQDADAFSHIDGVGKARARQNDR